MGHARFPFPSYPTGWFAVAMSDDIPPAGEQAGPITLRYFGRELVAYRGESGAPHVVDAYCPHMGAHLGLGGVIEGDSIRCPFHGWRFEGDGRCVEVPYSDRVPPKARLDAFEVLEQNGVVHVFHDPRGRSAWALPALDEEGWTPARSVLWRGLKTHPQEVFENTVDIAHIGPVHDGRGARITEPPIRDGALMEVSLEFVAPGDVVGMVGELNDVHLRVKMWGVGCTHVTTHVRNVDVHARQQIYATPIDEDTIDLRGVVQVRATDDPVFSEELAETFYEAYVTDFAKDFPIWENKRYLERPTLARGDGPIGPYRKWCRQFYVDDTVSAAEPPRDMVGELRDRWVGPVKRRLAVWMGRSKVAEPKPSTSTTTRATTSSATSEPAASKPPASLPVTSADEYFETLAKRFVPAAASGVDAVFQWELTGEGGRTFHARVHDGQIDIQPSPHAAPTVSLVMGADDYVRVVNGDLDGTWAFTNGRGKVRGSVRAAMKMRSLFPA